jgi:hypothetical protein
MAIDPWQQPASLVHSVRLLRSFERWTGRSLLGELGLDDCAGLEDYAGNEAKIAQLLFEVPFVVVSHGIEADPILNYGNRTALDLWQMTWESFTQTPSRLTAEPIERVERERLLEQARTQGYISDYQGVRIASTGLRFWIEDVVIWTVLDEAGKAIGQAATFQSWRPVT